MLKNANVKQVNLNTERGICEILMDNGERFIESGICLPESFSDYLSMLKKEDELIFSRDTLWTLDTQEQAGQWKAVLSAAGACADKLHFLGVAPKEESKEICEEAQRETAKSGTASASVKQRKQRSIPSVEELERELERVKYRETFNSKLKSTIFALITVAAAAILVASLLLPVLKIYGTSMTPTLTEESIVVSVKKSNFDVGDVIAFYFNNKILVKRVIAFPGDWVNIDEDGNVFVNGEQLEETYVDQPAMGDCDIELPYQVPDGKLFVMGDHRSTSQDSRLQMVGCVAEEQIVGQIVYKLWPFDQIGGVN